MLLNKLYKHIFIVLLLSVVSYTGYSQNLRMQARPQSQQFKAERPMAAGMRRIQVVKEGFIAQQLNLTRAQADKFWPIYRQYQNDLIEVRRLKRLNNSDAQSNGVEQVKKDLNYDEQLVNIRKHYNEEFMKVLPPEKVSQLIKAEREFNDELVRKLHEENAKPQ
jgi:Spy/CpxP family protein refolding chaperone